MITVTELAAKRINQSTKEKNALGIKVGVKTTGCSGLGYVLEYVYESDSTDQLFESHGVHIYVDPAHIDYLRGIEMDWVKRGLGAGFEFSNPNSKGECGCGESFRV